MLSEEKKVGSGQLAVEEKIVGSGQWARMRSAELKKVYQKTLWAGLKRIVLLRFLCFREEVVRARSALRSHGPPTLGIAWLLAPEELEAAASLPAYRGF